ncbi:hypothetical protein BF29_2900 [Heyndrickxia coagulans DSM 1 = ATCC 7050]|nr:hypothetical protein BF29_2900 [Heyndrickxia coagulans DSM 1 = ATCC 7050]
MTIDLPIKVTLLVSVWIEMIIYCCVLSEVLVTLLVSVWIEIAPSVVAHPVFLSHTPRECVD